MSRVGRVTTSGPQLAFPQGVLIWLRVLWEGLWTFRSDPLPPLVRLRRLPHGLLCIAAFGITFGGVAQLVEDGGLGPQLGFLIGLAQGGAVALALRRPVAAWWLSTAAMVVGAVLVRHQLLRGNAHDFPWPWTAAGILGHMAVLLLLALRVRTRVSAAALGLTAFLTYAVQGLLGAADYQSTGVVAVVLCTVVVLLGTALRGRRQARAALVEQEVLTAEERTRRTVLEERNRIARELHDVVAHHMSVISIQAQVAPHLVKEPTDELKENLAGIRQNALDALTELRRVLGVLRSESPEASESAPHAPLPTLARLDALVENARAAGLTVDCASTGQPRPLTPGVELSAFRIVQEALSNAIRHAPGTTVRIELAFSPSGLRVRVANTAPRVPAPRSPGAGHGLLGMRERAAMLGGDLATGPTPDGGYEVTAFLPGDTPAKGETEK
ncbi:sensor histidine kinase [Streptomyces sp. PKU-EA00015]|uniref:sensor histidine kinase n=1 Tax=Streptomyces sp. PKU-EA00015 TaxID=2748326 RepID=UPI0035C83119